MSIGSSHFGSGPFGSGLGFDLVSAVSSADNSVDATFSADLDFIGSPVLSTTSYSLDNGLVCIYVLKISESSVRLYTTPQIPGVEYTLYVHPEVTSVDSAELEINTAEFVRSVFATVYGATALSARTHCQGRRIDLFWTNPTPAPVYVKIVRRRKNWVFDLTDAHDLVYEGDVIDSFVDSGIITPSTTTTADAAIGAVSLSVDDESDFAPGDRVRVETLTGPINFEIVTLSSVAAGLLGVSALVGEYAAGARVSKSTPLVEQAFYYYTVLVSDVPLPPDFSFAFTDDNHAMGLSISVMDSKEDFFWNNTPAELRNRDSDEQLGHGFLDQWYEVMGCWLNIMRGTAKALKLMGNNDESPYNALSAKNFSMGIDPEGFSYDFEIPRRSVTSLSKVYKRRGTCNGLVLATRMFTKWDAVCAEFGVGGCNTGARPLTTWDGQSLADSNTSAGIVLANLSVTDPSKSYPTSQWKDGLLIGSIGDVCCVDDNTDTVITLKPVTSFLSMGSLGAPVAGFVVHMDSTSGLYPNMTVQLESATDSTKAQIVEIFSIVPNVSFNTKSPIAFNFVSGDHVSIQKSMIRAEEVGSGVWSPVGGSIYELLNMTVFADQFGWTQTQWVGYQILSSDNVKNTVISNEGDRLRVSAGSQPADGQFSIAKDFVVGGSFAARTAMPSYRVFSGTHSFLFEPTLDIEERGTIYNPFSRIWMGVGSPILGAWGPGDVGIYITTPVAVIKGLMATATGNVLFLDGAEPAPAVNELVGYFLNPNQNQNQLFVIVGNTASTVTLAADVSSLVVTGQAYYVLKPRDANRYRQLVGRFNKPAREFANLDIDVRVLFV